MTLARSQVELGDSFVRELEGLYLTRRISKQSVDGTTVYGS